MISIKNANELDEQIRQLPTSMLEAVDLEAVILHAQHLYHVYESFSDAERSKCAEIARLKTLLDSNSADLDPEHVKTIESPLKGKIIGYLGSSITVGMKSENISFPEYIGKRTESVSAKQAISGGTLAYKQSDAEHDYREEISYLHQLFDASTELFSQKHLDLLLVQLSTNDTTMDIPLGHLTSQKNTADFDCATVYGAIESIISAAIAKWNCDVMFYTNPYIHPQEYADLPLSEQKQIHQNLVIKYEKMVDALYEVQKKWPIGIIDLWHEPSFKNIDLDIKRYYMADIIHPYKAGYLFWYTPMIQKAMENAWTTWNSKEQLGC